MKAMFSQSESTKIVLFLLDLSDSFSHQSFEIADLFLGDHACSLMKAVFRRNLLYVLQIQTGEAEEER